MRMSRDTKSLDSLSLDLIKNHLQILTSDTQDDTLLTHLKNASFDYAEKYLHHPITSESYLAPIDENNTYELIHKPTNVYLYDNETLVEEVDFIYKNRQLIPNLPTTPPTFNTVKADVQGLDDNSITQARLLMIGSHYAVRENENYSNQREMPLGVHRLLDLAQMSLL